MPFCFAVPSFNLLIIASQKQWRPLHPERKDPAPEPAKLMWIIWWGTLPMTFHPRKIC